MTKTPIKFHKLPTKHSKFNQLLSTMPLTLAYLIFLPWIAEKNLISILIFVWTDSAHDQKSNCLKIYTPLSLISPFPPLLFTGNQILALWDVLSQIYPYFYMLAQDASCSAPFTLSYIWRSFHMGTWKELLHSLFSCLVLHYLAVTEFI